MSKQPNNTSVIGFVLILCISCSFVLASLASVLKPKQEKAAILDRNKQMLMAAKIFSYKGYFTIQNSRGEVVPAVLQGDKLVPNKEEIFPSSTEIFTLFQKRIVDVLVDANGKEYTFAELNINKDEYLEDNFKSGYASLPYKLLYKVLPNGGTETDPPVAYIFPVSGFGLWDAIYGYIAVENDGNTIIGISWYEHAETPGLGANIAEASWQSQFPGKKIFNQDPAGNTNFAKAPIGITVVRGKVAEVYGSSTKAISAVDGMAGATLTGNGVNKAYKESLSPYRPFLIKAHNKTQSAAR